MTVSCGCARRCTGADCSRAAAGRNRHQRGESDGRRNGQDADGAVAGGASGGEGHRPAILTRGYRGDGQSDASGLPTSDEVALLRERLGARAQWALARTATPADGRWSGTARHGLFSMTAFSTGAGAGCRHRVDRRHRPFRRRAFVAGGAAARAEGGAGSGGRRGHHALRTRAGGRIDGAKVHAGADFLRAHPARSGAAPSGAAWCRCRTGS